MTEEPPPEGYRGFWLQPSGATDHITDDGEELAQLPMPFSFTQDGDLIGDDHWAGAAAQILGFSKSLKDDNLDLRWEDAILDPVKMIGMYAVTINDADDVRIWYFAIQTVRMATFTNGRWKVSPV